MTQSGIQACDPTMASHNLWKHSWALWLLLDVQVGNSPTSNHRHQPREGLISQCSDLSLHLHSRSKGKDPYKSPRLWDLQQSWWGKPLQSTKLHFYTYFVLQCWCFPLLEREVSATVKPQMMTVQQWCWNLYKSLTLFFNQYKLKIAEQRDLDEH